MMLTTFGVFTLLSLDLDLRSTLFDLRLDEFVYCLGILVRHLLRLELSQLLLNQIDRELDGAVIDPRVDAVEIGVRLSQLILVAKDQQHKSFLVSGYADQMFAAMHDELPDCHLLGLGERISKDSVTLVGFVTIRQKVVRLFEIATVDLVPINKPRHVDGVLGFEFKLVKFLGLNEDVVALGVLIALDDFFFGDFLEAALRFNAL